MNKQTKRPIYLKALLCLGLVALIGLQGCIVITAAKVPVKAAKIATKTTIKAGKVIVPGD
tara:strand:- start:220 stop:399 length:180 start_codon:yes stop_codon:yes gene_type:complete